MEGSCALTTKGLTKVFGSRKVLDAIDLSVHEGEIYGLVGLNGAGKSTLMKLLAMQVNPSAGIVRYYGHAPTEAHVAGLIGSLIERPVFYGHMTVRDNLVCRAIVLGQLNIDKVVDDAIAVTGLSSYSDERVEWCSVGVRQRLGLGLAILGHPRILLLDEPFNGIDVGGVVSFSSWLASYAGVDRAAVVISTHVISQIGSFADRFGILAQGRLTRELSRREVLNLRRCDLLLECDAPERAVAMLRDKLGLNAVVLPDTSLRLNASSDIEGISEFLGRSGITIRSIRLEQETLEELFNRIVATGNY